MKRPHLFGLLALAMLLPQLLVPQTLRANGLQELLDEASAFGEAIPIAPFVASDFALPGESAVLNYRLLEADPAAWQRLLSERPMNVLLELPTPEGSIELRLTALQSPLGEGFQTLTSDGGRFDYQAGVYYKGLVEGQPNSLAAMSFFEDDAAGVISIDGFSYNLGRMRLDQAQPVFGIYRDVDMQADLDFSCGSASLPENIGFEPVVPQLRSAAACRAVNVRFDCDYEMYTDNGFSVSNTNNFVTGFFNAVQAVYLVDGFEIYISETNVYTSPDPYSGFFSSIDYLYAYQADMNATSWNGDVAQFLSTRPAGLGGIAFLDGNFCSRNADYSFSNIWTTYGGFPVYSWTVDVVSHEFGHNYGSPHTHSCSWSGGALDNCYGTEGSCSPGPPPPSSGGTIMSYCHLTSFGKDFSYGFHPQPAALMQANIDAMTCLQPCGGSGTCDTPTDLASIPGSGSVTVSWDPVAGATGYKIRGRRGASSWRELSVAGTSRFIGTLNNNKTYEWQAQAICGSSSSPWSASQFFTTLSFREAAFSASIYPNPVQEVLMVEPDLGGPLRVEVIDQAGRLLHTQHVQAQPGAAFAVQGLGDLPAGIYLLRLTGENATATLRFSK